MMTWKEKIVREISGRNVRGEIQWFNHKTIIDRLRESETDGMNIPTSVTEYMKQLVRTGHVERAIKPKELYHRKYKTYRKEYLYRWTGRKFVAPDPCAKLAAGPASIDADDMRLGRELYWKHKKLPKWFRQMMK